MRSHGVGDAHCQGLARCRAPTAPRQISLAPRSPAKAATARAPAAHQDLQAGERVQAVDRGEAVVREVEVPQGAQRLQALELRDLVPARQQRAHAGEGLRAPLAPQLQGIPAGGGARGRWARCAGGPPGAHIEVLQAINAPVLQVQHGDTRRARVVPAGRTRSASVRKKSRSKHRDGTACKQCKRARLQRFAQLPQSLGGQFKGRHLSSCAPLAPRSATMLQPRSHSISARFTPAGSSG